MPNRDDTLEREFATLEAAIEHAASFPDNYASFIKGRGTFTEDYSFSLSDYEDTRQGSFEGWASISTVPATASVYKKLHNIKVLHNRAKKRFTSLDLLVVETILIDK